MNNFDENKIERNDIIEGSESVEPATKSVSPAEAASASETPEVIADEEKVDNGFGEMTYESSTNNAWGNSSYIREYSPVSSENTQTLAGNTVAESVDRNDDSAYEENTISDTTDETSSQFIKETVKKSGLKKFVAIAVVAGIINVAALGGIFFFGYKMGSGNTVNSVATEEKLDAETSKKNALSVLNQKPAGKPAQSQAETTPTVVQGQEMTTVDISKKVGPAVVGITSSIESGMSIFGGSGYSEGTGSGIIFTEDGYIVTNNHVIEGAAKVSVTLNTGSEYEAEVIGADSRTDLAVLKISPKEQLTIAEFGDSSSLEVGERAIAIGNPLGMEFFGSTTQGIISAVNRSITVDNKTMSVIQTDAAINEGNSGGALVNAYGQVIGINAVKISSSTVEGMGFAIPISEAKPVISDLIEFGYVKGRPVIGITSRDVTDYMAKRQGWPLGVQVLEVQIGSGAEIAGLEQGDIIVKVDGKEIKTVDELNEIKNKHKPGESLAMEVYKYETGLKENVSVKLGEERPE